MLKLCWPVDELKLRPTILQGGLDFLTRALNLAIQLDNLEVKAAILQASGIALRHAQ